MSSEKKSHLTPEEYLRIEREAEFKSEYWNGEMFAMSGESRVHGRIKWNIGGLLYPQLQGGGPAPCQGFSSDMRVKVSSTGLYTYPDIVIVCGEPHFEDQHVDTLTNPTLLAEVLSDSTESYDRGRKSGHYRSIESLEEYILVSQTEPRIEVYSRHSGNTWLLSEAQSMQGVIRLSSINCTLRLQDVYNGVGFEDEKLK